MKCLYIYIYSYGCYGSCAVLAAVSDPQCPQQEFSRHVGLKVAVGFVVLWQFLVLVVGWWTEVNKCCSPLPWVGSTQYVNIRTIDSGHIMHSSNV